MNPAYPEIVIKATRGFSTIRFRELWEYRELFYFLVWRDIKIRYKQTLLGATWALIRPLMGMVIFTLLFNKLLGFSVEGVPYLLFTFCGIVVWNFFSEGVVGASQSLLANANLITKVYFPRTIIPAAAIISGLLDFFIAFILAIVLMLYFHYSPTITIVFLPLFIMLSIVTSLGIGLLFSSISVQYRDIAHALPYFIQVIFWITPIGYTASTIPQQYQLLYWLNPIVCVIEGFRWSILHTGSLPAGLTILSVSMSFLLFILGLMNFLRMERRFADVI
jgi:lipopolysaccharide transport system permease protein